MDFVKLWPHVTIATSLVLIPITMISNTKKMCSFWIVLVFLNVI